MDFLQNNMQLKIPLKNQNLLKEPDNPFYEYDLLGILKSNLVKHFYIDAKDECPEVGEVIRFTENIGAILAYSYLGDIEESVTGDKKKQKFEDEYIDELFEELHNLGFKALTYMPARNSLIQLQKVKKLCSKYGFLEISGEDINNPRQSFICNALFSPEFKNLIDTTWAVIGHENAVTEDYDKGFFSPSIIKRYPDIKNRIEYFKDMGLKIYSNVKAKGLHIPQ